MSLGTLYGASNSSMQAAISGAAEREGERERERRGRGREKSSVDSSMNSSGGYVTHKDLSHSERAHGEMIIEK
jgi:hypothetical protein